MKKPRRPLFSTEIPGSTERTGSLFGVNRTQLYPGSFKDRVPVAVEVTAVFYKRLSVSGNRRTTIAFSEIPLDDQAAPILHEDWEY